MELSKEQIEQIEREANERLNKYGLPFKSEKAAVEYYIAGSTKYLLQSIEDKEMLSKELNEALDIINGYDWDNGDPGDVIMRVEKCIAKAKQLLSTNK